MDTALKKSFDRRFAAIRTLDRDQLIPVSDQAGVTLMDAAPGSFFTCLSRTYAVQEVNPYQEMDEDFSTPQDYVVTELTCLCLETGETVHFEWEYDDELEVSLTLEQIRFRQLADDQGQAVDEDDLDQIIKDKDAVVYDGRTFWYEDDWAALYRRGSKTEKVYMIEFENEAGNRFLTVEEWTGSGRDSYRIYLSQPVDPGQITLLSKGVSRDEAS